MTTPAKDESQPGSNANAATNPTAIPGRVMTLGEDPMTEVDDQQHDHRAGEQQANSQQGLPPDVGVLQDEHRRGQQLNERIDWRDSRPTGAAAPTQEHETENRNVLEPPKRPFARRTSRAWPHD